MTTQIGSPFIPPDDTLLSVSTSGALQLKPGTQGDVLYAGAAGVWAKLGTGTLGQLLKAGGAGGDPSWATIATGEWNLLETLSPSGATTITTGALAAYKAYKVVVLDVVGTGTADWLALRFDGDTGANYYYKYISGTTITAVAAASEVQIAEIYSSILSYGEALIAGKTGPGTGYVGVSVISPAYPQGAAGTPRMLLGGLWSGGASNQIGTITVKSSGGQTFTGTIYVFGRN